MAPQFYNFKIKKFKIYSVNNRGTGFQMFTENRGIMKMW